MLKTRRTKRTFSPEFKLEAIEQVVKYLRDVREVALALELNPDHLRKWIRLYKQELQGIEPTGNAITPTHSDCRKRNFWLQRAARVTLTIMPWPKVSTVCTKRR
ncbi:Transposase [Edwardsiella tarda]|nr:Transposase [Edwardsiella tarda]